MDSAVELPALPSVMTAMRITVTTLVIYAIFLAGSILGARRGHTVGACVVGVAMRKTYAGGQVFTPAAARAQARSSVATDF